MSYRVTDIEFDFDSPEVHLHSIFFKEEQEIIIEETKDRFWKAGSEEELIEMITDATGWCIKSISCEKVG